MIEHHACNVGCLNAKPNGTDSNCCDLKSGVDFSIDLDFLEVTVTVFKNEVLVH